MKLGSEKLKGRSINTFRVVRRRCRETLSCPSKTVEGSSLSGDAALTSARICLTHEEGSLLSDDAALAPARICRTQEVEGENLKQGTKTMLKPEESPHLAKEPILARRAAATWLAKRLVRRLDSKVNLCRRSIGFSRFYIFSTGTLMRILRLGFL